MELDAHEQALAQARADDIDIRTLCERLRAAPVPESLPARYGEVLADLLDRLESSAMFSGESCSFSQEDLLQAVETWIARARAQLAR